jgi:hypothetical protein
MLVLDLPRRRARLERVGHEMNNLERLGFVVLGIALGYCVSWAAAAIIRPAHSQEAPQQQVACAPAYGAMKKQLEDNFGEVPTNMALSGQSGMTLFVSPGGATFTLTATRVDGRTCIVVAGKDWAELAAPIIGDPT